MRRGANREPAQAGGCPPAGRKRIAGTGRSRAAASSDLLRCLVKLLELRGWRGSEDDLLRALPHDVPQPDLTDIRNALAALGHATRPVACRRGRVDPRLLPAMLVAPDGSASVLFMGENGEMLRFDAHGGATSRADGRLAGRIYGVRAPSPARRGESWVGGVLRRFTPEISPLLCCSAFIALAGLGAPLFVMRAFDLVSTSREAAVLPALVGGAAMALAAEAWLRGVRRKILARVGERLDWLVATNVFSQLMALPVNLVHGAGRAAQVSRIRDFTGIREFITGPFAIAAMDLPSSLLALALLIALAGWLALAPAAAAALFVLLYLVARGPLQRAVAAASATGQKRDALALETLEAQRTLKLGAAEDIWMARCSEATAEAARASARAAVLSGKVMLVAQALVTLTALAAATTGVLGVLTGRMEAGALIAGMMLIWRVLSPLQTGFMVLSRWRQTMASIRQVDNMMGIETERRTAGRTSLPAPTRGEIRFSKVSLRLPGAAEPVLAGASFVVRQGEMVAVTGAHGAGKSTLLRLASGMLAPQSGAVRIDGHDARAYSPSELRRAMACVPQSPNLIYGTIAQNLRLVRPAADENSLRRALAEARALDAVDALPKGLETRISDHAEASLPRSLLIRLTLARALLSKSPFLLLDEVAAGLDDEASDAFADAVAARRGRCTILMISHRPSHIRLADRVLHIQEGQLTIRGSAAEPTGPHRMPVARVGRGL